MAEPLDNLFVATAVRPEEEFVLLAERAGCRIERIVSHGQASPPGFWYDQPQAEWVALLAGTAELEFADGRRRSLVPGAWLLLAPHERHRVASTSIAPPAIWLAVHLPP